MTRKIIRIGTSPNDGTGDTLRETANKINYNFTELYGVLGIEGCGADISIRLQPSCGSDLILTTCGTGKVIIGDPENPVISIPSPTDPSDVVIRPPSSTKKITIGDPTCGSTIDVPGCTTGDPISIGDPEGPRITVPPVGSPDPITIGDPEGPKITLPPPGSNDPITIGDPSGPSVTLPPPGSTDPITIGDPSGPKITLPPPGSTNPITIGDPEGPKIVIPPKDSDDPITIGDPSDPTKPIKIGNFDPYKILYTDGDGNIKAGPFLGVGHGTNISNEDTLGWRLELQADDFNVFTTPDGRTQWESRTALYFTDTGRNVSDWERELVPSNRHAAIGYINHSDEWGYGKLQVNQQNYEAVALTMETLANPSWDGGWGEYNQYLYMSPWAEEYGGIDPDGGPSSGYEGQLQGDTGTITIMRRQNPTASIEPGLPVPPGNYNRFGTVKIGLGTIKGEYLSHGVTLGWGAMALGGRLTTNSASVKWSDLGGETLIVLNSSDEVDGGESQVTKYIGQISTATSKVVKDDKGVTEFALGWKEGKRWDAIASFDSEHNPSRGINTLEDLERLPGKRTIIWNIEDKVSINEAELTDTFNVKGNVRLEATPIPETPEAGTDYDTGIVFPDDTYQYTAWQGVGEGKSIDVVGTEDEIEVTLDGSTYTVGLVDDVKISGSLSVNGLEKWESVYTNADDKLDSSPYIKVQEPKDEIHSIPGYGEVGRNKQFEAANIVIEPHLDDPDPAHPGDPVRGVAGLYFNRPTTDALFGEAQNLKALNPTRRAGYIKYWSNNGGEEYTGQLELSPWYQGASSFNTNLIDNDYIAGDDRALFITRYRDFFSWGPVVPDGFLGEPNETSPLRTSQYQFNGGGGHQAVSISGSIDFATINGEGGMYKSNVPQFSAGANMGYSYINIPALHTHTGPKWIGQFSSNAKKIRNVLPGSTYEDSDGIPFWSLGYKMSTQLIENYPSIGIAQYERIPDNHAISWDVRGRVSINEATLDETLNILGSIKIQVASTENDENGVVNANYRAGRKQTGEENEVGIYFADGTFQYTAWLGIGPGKSVDIVGTANEVEVTPPAEGEITYTIGLPDDVIITGNLTVNGTTTTINSTTLTVDDKNIELGSVATPTDTTANGGGITLKGATDKTIIWDQPKDRWVFNPGIETPKARITNLTANKLVVTDGTKDLVSLDGQLYSISAETATGGANLRLTNSMDNVTDDVKLASGTNVSVTRTDANTITIASSNTTYSHSAETATGGALIRLTGSDATNDDVKLASGTDITVSRTDADTITVTAANQRLEIVDDPTGNVTYNMMMTTASSGRISTANVDNADLTYNPSTGTLTTPNLLVSQSGVDFTGAVNALYYGSAANRVTLANYNSGGKITFEVNGGAYTAHFNADGTYQFANLYTTAVGASPKPLAVGSDGIIGYGEATGDTLYDAGTHSTGATLYLNRNNGTIQKVLLASNVTDIVISNIAAARSFTIILTQDGSGSRTLATNNAFKYASGYKTLSTAAGAVDMLNIFYDGTTYYCTLTTGYA